MRKYKAVPKKYEGKPRARGAVDRNTNERRQKIEPATINIPDIMYATIYIVLYSSIKKLWYGYNVQKMSIAFRFFAPVGTIGGHVSKCNNTYLF